MVKIGTKTAFETGLISTVGWDNLTFPSSVLSYGKYNQAQHNVMIALATQWYIDDPQDVAVETTGNGRALVARMVPATSGTSGSNQIKSGSYIPTDTDQQRVNLAFKMQLRPGFSFGDAANENTAKLGFGLHSTVNASGGFPKDDGWPIQWTMRRLIGQAALPKLYVYSGKTPSN